MSFSSIRFAGLIFAMLTYAIWGTPTPDTPSVTELTIALSLSIACVPGLFHALHIPNLLYRAGIISLSLGGTIPILIGLLNNTDLHDLTRDFIAYIFLFMPLFALDLLKDNQRRSKIFIASCIFIATNFSLRSFITHENLPVSLTALGMPLPTLEPTYLANSPLILFSAGLAYYGAIFRKSLIVKAICAFILLSCAVAAALSLQRATLFSLTLIAITAHMTLMKDRPTTNIIILALMTGVVIWLQPYLTPLWDLATSLQEKTQTHGLNKRQEEWQAMLDVLTTSPQSIIFGLGWGAGFYSPATDGEYVTFTHGLISALVFKTGILGAIIATPYFLHIAQSLKAILSKNILITLCLALPFIINLTLYGAYKSFDFGLLLVLITLPFFRGEDLSSAAHPVVKAKQIS